MELDKRILIFGELDGDQPSLMTAQLMRIGKRLSEDLGQELGLIFFGSESTNAVETGYGYGADKVYTAFDPSLEHYMTDAYLQAMEQVVQELARLLTNKLTHTPSVQIRQASYDGRMKVLDIVRELFDLANEP